MISSKKKKIEVGCAITRGMNSVNRRIQRVDAHPSPVVHVRETVPQRSEGERKVRRPSLPPLHEPLRRRRLPAARVDRIPSPCCGCGPRLVARIHACRRRRETSLCPFAIDGGRRRSSCAPDRSDSAAPPARSRAAPIPPGDAGTAKPPKCWDSLTPTPLPEREGRDDGRGGPLRRSPSRRCGGCRAGRTFRRPRRFGPASNA